MAHRLLRVTQLNAVPAPYEPILRLQELLFEQRRAGMIPDTLLQLEHDHVYTMGKRGCPADFLSDAAGLRAAGAAVAATPRGGETTYHGPGQLVLYPIISLRELGIGARAYVEGLEDVMVATLGRYGIAARGRVPGKTGVWVGERKVGAVGVRISQGVTTHGIALNVSTDLSFFSHIIPCGTPDKEVTSVQRQLAAAQQSQQAQRADCGQWQQPGCQDRRHQQEQRGQGQDARRPGTAAEATEAAAAAMSPAEAAAAMSLPSSSTLPPLAAVPLPQVADSLLDAFMAHFGYSRLDQLPDVNQLATHLGCSSSSTGSGSAEPQG